MPSFEHTGRLDVSAEALYTWHARPGGFDRLAPPWERMRVVERSGTIRDGDRVVMKVKVGPLWITWVAELFDHVEGRQFRDRQLRGPFRRWVHTHRFLPEGPDLCTMQDHIEYELPIPPLGAMLQGRATVRRLRRMMEFRHRRLREDLRRHSAAKHHGPQRVIISGASGMIGSQLGAFLSTGGHEVQRLVRRAARPGSGEIEWRPAQGRINASALEGADALIHLAGAGIADRPWTPARKREIVESRVDGTRVIAQALARLRRPPRVLLCASAVGFYGDRGDEELSEESGPDTGFLPESCLAWEEATLPARRAGIRVVRMRLGVVLSPTGGALAKMLPPFRLGLGGKLGSGRQWTSWISLDDAIGAIHHLVFDEEAEGPFNLTAPNPVTNAEFTKTLGRAVRRPAMFPVPAFAVRTLFGEMGQRLLLEGNRVLPRRLEESGFTFLHPDLGLALRRMLGVSA